MKRRLFAIAMTLAMALSLLPTAALAEEAPNGTQSSATVADEPGPSDPTNGPSDEEAGSETTSENRTETADCPGGDNCTHAAAIGDTHYDTLQEAITAVSENGTITLIQNFTQNSALTVTDKTFTLDMAGKTITLGNIEDNSGAILLNGSSNVTINGDGSFTYDEETYAGESSQSSGQMIGVDGNATLTIENGDFHAGLVCVRAGENAKVYIEGGKFYADATYDNRVWVLNKQDNENATFYVTGGTFVNYDPSNSDTENPTDNFVASGYTVVESEGTYIVVPLTEENSVASVGGEYYTTLAEAIEAAQSGDTVTLLADAKEKITIDADDNLILDLNGHWVIDTVNNSPAALTNNGTITIKDTVGTGGIKRQDNPNTSSYYTIRNEGTMTITGGTVSNDSGSESEWRGSSLVCNGATNAATLNITGGTFQQDNFIVIKNDEKGTLDISGGTVISNTQAVQNWCNATISGGTLTGEVTSWTYLSTSATTTISGGDITGDLSAVKLTYNNTAATNKPVVNISGTANIRGEISVGTQTYGQDNSYRDDATAAVITITGGTFTAKPDDSYLGTGLAFIGDEDGPWTVGVADGMEASTDADGDTASATVGGNFATSGSNGDNVSTDESATIKISVTTGEEGTENTSVTTTNVTIAPESLTSVSGADEIQNVEIATDVGTLTVDKTAWNTITENAKGESVTLSISQVQTANDNQPLAYELTAKAGETDVFAQGSSGTIKVDVPYTGTSAHVYYVGNDGAEAMTEVIVDQENDRLSWTVNHFSTYVVTQTETGTFAATKDGDTTNITTYESLDAALDALTSNADDTVTITLLEDAILSESYTVKSDLTIQGNVTITLNVPNNNYASPTLIGITVANGGSLTLDNGVTLNINGGSATSAGTTKYYGTGIDVNFGGELTVQNGATVNLKDLNRGTISSKPSSSPDTAGQFTLNNSTMTATNIGGNFSNGGDWTIDDSTLTMKGVGNYGLSAGTITTTGSSQITATGVAYSAIYGHNEINIGGTTQVNVTACGSGLPYRSEGNYGDATAPIQLKVVRDNTEDEGTGTKPNTDAEIIIGEEATVSVTNCKTEDGEDNNTIYVPAGATYTNNGTVTGTVASSGEAMIDGRVYDTLAKAIENAQNGDVVTLLKDVELDGTDKNNNEGLLDISKSITLDGNEHKITAKNVTVAEGTTNGPSMINITGDIKVTVRDLTIDGAGSTDAATDNTKHGLNIYGGADVTVENVTIQNGNGYAIVANGSTVTVNGLTTSNNSWGGINVDSKSGEASLTIENATINEENSIKFENSSEGSNDDPSAEIKDGNFQYITAGDEIAKDKLDLTISGGTFATGSTAGALDVEDYLKDGLAIDSNGNVYQPSQGGGSSGGGSSVTRYTVSVPDDIEGGSIRVSPTRASRGQTVTITVDPDEGYELDRLVVRDADGDRIDLERKSDTKYTFEMPRGKVTVEATFTEIEEEDAIPFRDVDTDDWFYDAVVYAYDTGLMSGVSDDQFAPDATLTRAMVAQMLYSLEGKPRTGSAGYADVAFGAWYEDAVAWISSEGLMTGYSDTAFGPDDPLTREQLALILYNYADWAGYDVRGGVSLGSYIDADSASAWAVEALEWAIDAGLISGRGNGILAPAGTATRAEVAQIFMNFLENVAQ